MGTIDKDKLVKLSNAQKRMLQYSYLKDWSKGKLTGLDCIVKIVEREKLIFINKDILEAAKNETQ